MGRLGGSGVGVGVDSRVVRGHLGSVCRSILDVDESRKDGARGERIGRAGALYFVLFGL